MITNNDQPERFLIEASFDRNNYLILHSDNNDEVSNRWAVHIDTEFLFKLINRSEFIETGIIKRKYL